MGAMTRRRRRRARRAPRTTQGCHLDWSYGPSSICGPSVLASRDSPLAAMRSSPCAAPIGCCSGALVPVPLPLPQAPPRPLRRRPRRRRGSSLGIGAALRAASAWRRRVRSRSISRETLSLQQMLCRFASLPQLPAPPLLRSSKRRRKQSMRLSTSATTVLPLRAATASPCGDARASRRGGKRAHTLLQRGRTSARWAARGLWYLRARDRDLGLPRVRAAAGAAARVVRRAFVLRRVARLAAADAL